MTMDHHSASSNACPCWDLTDLWTDPEVTEEQLLKGTARLVPSLLFPDHPDGVMCCITLYDQVLNDSSSSKYWSTDPKEDELLLTRQALLLVADIPHAKHHHHHEDDGCKTGSSSTGSDSSPPMGVMEVFSTTHDQEPEALLAVPTAASTRLNELACRLSTIWHRKSGQTNRERRLVESLQIAKLGQWELDLVNNKLIWSDEIYNMFQVDKEEFGASYEAFLNVIHPDDREFVNLAYTNSLTTKKNYNIMHRLLFPDETIKWVTETCRTEYHPVTGQPLYSVGIVQDVTELKQAQEMDRLKSRFLANMSHEIRTPLNAILGYTDLLLLESRASRRLSLPEEASTPQQKQACEYLHTIKSSGQLLLAIIGDLLDISKIEAGQLHLTCKPMSLTETIRAVYDSGRAFHARLRRPDKVQMSFPTLAAKKNDNGCQEAVDDCIAQDCIMGDSARIQQVLNNLVNNAIKFTHVVGRNDGQAGLVECHLRLVSTKQGDNGACGHAPKQFLEFQVKDTGVGIPMDKQQEIFQAFHQAHPSRDARELGGTGLGLTISKKLVDMMGGEMKLQSSTDGPDQGTTVSFTIPYQPVDLEHTKEEKSICSELSFRTVSTAPPSDSSTVSTTPSSLSSSPLVSESKSVIQSTQLPQLPSPPHAPSQPGKVLIVDDNRVNLKLAVRLVTNFGYETLTATNGEEAVTMYQEDRLSSAAIQVILMDKEMPTMDGLQATEEIRRMERGNEGANHVLIVALTAAAMSEDRDACLAAGCDRYLTKPINRRELQDTLSRYMSANPAA